MKLGALRTALETALREIGSGLRLTPPRRIVAARVEGERSMFPAAERITGRMLDDIVATFDPERRRVPITLGHVAGRKDGGVEAAPLGLVVGVMRQGDDLLLDVRSIVDPSVGLSRVDIAVSEGFAQQSIGFLPASPEVGGRSQLLELALLGSTAQGIPGLPRMDESGFGLSTRDLETLAAKRTKGAGLRDLFTSAGDVLSAWKPFAGFNLEPVAGIATRSASQFAAVPPAVEEDDELEVLLMDPIPATPETPPAEPSGRDLLAALTTEVRSLVAALTARPATPPPTPPAPEPAAPAPPATEISTRALTERATRAVRSAIGALVLTREQAPEQIRAAVAGGEPAVRTLELAMEAAVQQRSGRIFRELRVPREDGTDEAIRVAQGGGRAFHFVGGVCGPPRQEQLDRLAIAGRRAAKFAVEGPDGVRSIPTPALLRALAETEVAHVG